MHLLLVPHFIYLYPLVPVCTHMCLFVPISSDLNLPLVPIFTYSYLFLPNFIYLTYLLLSIPICIYLYSFLLNITYFSQYTSNWNCYPYFIIIQISSFFLFIFFLSYLFNKYVTVDGDKIVTKIQKDWSQDMPFT